MQFQTFVMLQIDVCVTADLYHAEQPDKTQNRLTSQTALIYFLACTRVNTVCLHLGQQFETVLEELKLDTDVTEETFA